MQDFKARATQDIDIIPKAKGLTLFLDLCKKKGIQTQVISILSTVDFDQLDPKEIYHGEFLKVNALSSTDLIKSKLERFFKQDPEDIYAMIEKDHIAYDDFKDLVQEMLADFVGEKKWLVLIFGKVLFSN